MNATADANGSTSVTVAQPETNAVIPTYNRKLRKYTRNMVNAPESNGAVVNNISKKRGKTGRPKKQSSCNSSVRSSVTNGQSTIANQKSMSTNRIQPIRVITSSSVFADVNLPETLANFGIPQNRSAIPNNINRSTEEITDSQLDTLFTPNMIFTKDAAVQTEGLDDEVLTMNAYTQTNIPVQKRLRAVRDIATNTIMIGTDLVPMNKHYLFDRHFTQQLAYRTDVDETFLRHTIFDLLSEDNDQETPMPYRRLNRPAPPPFHASHDIVPQQNRNLYGWQQCDYAGNHVNDFVNFDEIDDLTNLTMRLNTLTQDFDNRQHAHDELERYGCNLSPIPQEVPPIHASDFDNNVGIGLFDPSVRGSQDVLNQGFLFDGDKNIGDL